MATVGNAATVIKASEMFLFLCNVVLRDDSFGNPSWWADDNKEGNEEDELRML